MEAILESDLIEFVLDLGSFSVTSITPHVKTLKYTFMVANLLFLGITLAKYIYYMLTGKWTHKKSILFSSIVVVFNMIMLAYTIMF